MYLEKKSDGHNKSTPRKMNALPPKAFNCRQPAHCALDGNCLKSAIIYQATVTTQDNRPAETYVGLTESSFLRPDMQTISLLLETQTRDSLQNSAKTSQYKSLFHENLMKMCRKLMNPL